MSSLLKRVNTPQTIYILGSACELTDEECVQFGITDDYATIDFYSGDKEVLCCFDNVGYIYILTKEQLLAVKDKLINSDDYEHHSGLEDMTGLPERGQYVTKYGAIIRNFVGDIEVDIVDKNTGISYLNNYIVEEHSYIFEQRDDHPEDADLEDRIVLPEGFTVEEVSLYEIIDEVNGATYMQLPDVTNEDDIYDIIVEFDRINYQSFDRGFCWRIHIPAFLGFLIGKGYKEVASKYMTIYKNGGTTYGPRNTRRPVFFHDFIDELDKQEVNTRLLLAEFIASTDVYKERFNEFYKPLRRPLDNPEKYEENEDSAD